MGEAIWSESGYAAAIKRNIMRNAFTTFRRTYPRAEEVRDYLQGHLPAKGQAPANFLESMAQNLLQRYGKLSEKQYAAVCKTIDDRAAKAQQRQQAIEAQRERSQHLGVKAERREFTVTVEKVLEVSTAKFSYYSPDTALLYLMRDAEGNRVVLKTTGNLKLGDRYPAAGDTVTLTATIKYHDEYKGERQTVVQRAKLLKFHNSITDEA